MDALDPTPGEVDKSAFFDGAQKTTEVNGTSFGVPWYVETRLVYYRTDLAKKAGITSPPTDWDGLKTMAKAMGALGNVLGKGVLRKAFSTPDVEKALRPVIGIEQFGAGLVGA